MPRACDRDRPTDVAAARVHPTPPARRAARGSPRVYAGEVHVDPTSRRAARGPEAPASGSPRVHAGEAHVHPTFPRRAPAGSPRIHAGEAHVHPTSRRARSRKPPRLRGGVSPSPYVAPRALAEAPAFTRGSLTFTLRAPRAARRSPRVYAWESHVHPTSRRAARGLEPFTWCETHLRTTRLKSLCGRWGMRSMWWRAAFIRSVGIHRDFV